MDTDSNPLSLICEFKKGFAGKTLSQLLSRLTLPGTLAIIIVLGRGSDVAAADEVHLPPVNLGETTFEDGIGYPGWIAQEIIEYYHAGQVNDSAGDKLPGSNKFTSVSSTTHLAYLSNLRLLGAYYGAEFLLPLANVESDANPSQSFHTQGVGDLIVSPFVLQWSDQKIFGMPYFHRLDLAGVLPTGQYNRDKPINIGNNVFSFDPYYAFTVVPTDKLELSARLHYLWNSRNNRPFRGLGADSIQPGQAFHANFAASYRIIPELRFGFNGYVLQQVTDDEVNGHSQPNSRERVFGVGPGIEWSSRASGISIYINCYFESGVENRPAGTKAVFRVSKTF